MKYQLHLNRQQKLICLLYLFCVLFAGLIIGFSIRFDRDAGIGNNTGTDWKGYVSGGLEIAVLTEPKRGSRGTASLHSNVDHLYKANNLVIPDVIRKNNKLYDLVQIDSEAFYIEGSTNPYLTGSLTIGKNIKIIKERAFSQCYSLTGKLIINKNIEIERAAFALCCFQTLTISKNVIIQANAFANNLQLETIICDGWSSLPTTWEAGIFIVAKTYGHVKSINSTFSSTEILGFLQSHGLGSTWQAA